MIKTISIFCFAVCWIFLNPAEAVSQDEPDPRAAFLRSLAVPGWGHYYADPGNWNRGKLHLGSEIVMVASYFGFRARASNLENQYLTLASLRAGVDISQRGRAFQLAMGDFNNLHEYNDFQLRSRNWNRLIDDQPQNRWNWKSESDRNKYNELRSDRDRVRNQLPAILGLMAVNRVVSAVSAYNRAGKQGSGPEFSLSPVLDDQQNSGFVASLNFRF